MLLSKILGKRRGPPEESFFVSNARGDERKSAGAGKIVFEMNLHVPCKISGITRNGLRWEGEATTIGINSFGAHLLVPGESELEGEVSLRFQIPVALRPLFVRKTFRVRASTRPSGAAGPGLAPMGRKIVYVAFAEPLNFKVRAAGLEA
jgi:hypothetical protein